ncbi:acyltransferase family protein [Microlunatus parietis]|uniref:Fucose 4-O-acetylase-like acetyltransferase n=1 Tax=Microlunatus parietis TaxID=682979 RepID=A0A7Y9L9Z6_9ACTN|nr:acyltransferase family protein [Microlunatus parietis]NYE72314.1 fucose 4-O-acetylase-like acetyltransferase [Microlunatus parietis]
MNLDTRAAPAPDAARPSGRPRLYWIDTVRIALTVLVLAHHCAVTYGNIPVWFYNEPPHDPSASVLDILVVINQSYFMGLFFLISGYFVPGSIDRKGPGAFARDRLVRLGLPLLAFVILIRPLASFWSWRTNHADVPYPLYYLVSFDPGPTWFLEVLLVFSLIYAGYRALRSRAVPKPTDDGKLRWIVAAGTVVGLIVIMGILMAAWRQLVPDGTYWPIVGLPTPSFLPQYALMFAAGVLAARRRWLERMPGSLAFLGGGLALLAAVLLGPSVMATDPLTAGIAGGFAMAVLGVGLSLVVLVIFRRFAPGTGPIRQFLSANAFAVYVIHPAVLVAIALLLQGLVAPAIVKFAVLLILSIPACWLLAALLRRIPAVGRII